MRFHSADRVRFFSSFGELISSGVAPPRAVEILSRTAPRGQRQLFARLERGLQDGRTLGDLLWDLRDELGAMEAGVLRASERAGRVEHACQLLAKYHGALDTAKRAVFRKTAYPIFLLHFGILILPVSTWVTRGARAYFENVGITLIWIYTVGIALFALSVWVVRAAGSSAAAEFYLSVVPVAGRAFRHLAVGRFAFAFESSLEAGVNAPSALEAAGTASGSASIRRATDRMLGEVRAGSSISEAMRKQAAFPKSLLRAFEVGAETGRVDAELRRIRDESFDRGLAGIDLLSEWLPRLLYIGVVLAMAWQIVGAFQGIVGGYRGALDF